MCDLILHCYCSAPLSLCKWRLTSSYNGDGDDDDDDDDKR